MKKTEKWVLHQIMLAKAIAKRCGGFVLMDILILEKYIIKEMDMVSVQFVKKARLTYNIRR